MASVNNRQIVEFDKLFGEEPKPIDHYLKGISRKKLLLVGTHFLGFRFHNSEDHHFSKFLAKFFHSKNETFKDLIILKCEELQERGSGQLLIVNTESSLEFFQYAFEKGGEEEFQTELEIEKNVLLAYLALNQKTRQHENRILPSVADLPNDQKISAVYFTQSYAYSNLVNYDESELVTAQFIKAFFFFEFAEARPDMAPLLASFYHHYNITHWRDYIFKLFPIIKGILDNDKEGHLDFNVRPGDKYKEDCDFLDKLILNAGEVVEDYDFKRIRNAPMYKVAPGVYRIILSLFVHEKLFKGLYFKFSDINNTLKLTDQIKNLRSLITDSFSEQTLAYEILNSIYKNSKVTFTGQELKGRGVTAEPDYYLRDGNKIFVFESKDFLIRADIKTSYDFQLLKSAFEKSLYRDGKSNKAILQILNTCKKILDGNFAGDDKYDTKDISIYPIILVHDHQYNVVGLNKIINEWLAVELKVLIAKDPRFELIRPITIVNIDSLIYNQDLFRTGELRLDEVLDAYFKRSVIDRTNNYANEEHWKEAVIDTLIPFSNFLIETVMASGKAKSPKMFIEKAKNLFEK
jgi:hypothetical protein